MHNAVMCLGDNSRYSLHGLWLLLRPELRDMRTEEIGWEDTGALRHRCTGHSWVWVWEGEGEGKGLGMWRCIRCFVFGVQNVSP